VLIAEFVQTCPLCQRIKPDRRATQGLLQPLPLPTRKWQSIAIDWVLGRPETWRKGVAYDSTLTVVDSATKMIHLLPTQKNCTAVDRAELLLLNVCKYHGLPRSIVSDRDPKLTAQYWLKFCNDPTPVTDPRPQDRTEITALKQTADSGLQTVRALATSKSPSASTTTSSPQSLPPELAQVLEQFEDVFPAQLPLGLPP